VSCRNGASLLLHSLSQAAELSSALVQADSRKRIEQELREKIDGISAELAASQDALRKAEKAIAQLRVKNTVGKRGLGVGTR
jgi:hypothetical protein